jgi:hypothetical protein
VKARGRASLRGEELDNETGSEEAQVTGPEAFEAQGGCCRDQRQEYEAREGNVVSASGGRLPDQ